MGSIVPSAVTSRQGFKSSESNFCKSKGEVMISVSSKQLTPGMLSFISEQDLIKTGSKIGTLWKRRGGVEGVVKGVKLSPFLSDSSRLKK